MYKLPYHNVQPVIIKKGGRPTGRSWGIRLT
jgi:hypothetical protein